jgi:hypothetical protein
LKLKIFALFILIAANAVVAKANKLDENTILVVLVEEMNKKMVDKLNPSELESYKLDIENYNTNIVLAVKQYWKHGSKVEYKSKQELDALIAQKKSNTLYLIYSKYTFNYADVSSYKLTNKLYANSMQVVENYNKKHLPMRASKIEVKWADEPVNTAAYATVQMPSVQPKMADFTYAIKNLNLQIAYKSKGTTEVQLMKMYIKNAPHLKELELHLNINDIEKNEESEIKSNYKYALKISPPEKINEIILTGDKTKAVQIKIPNDDGSFTFKIIDAATCDVLGSSSNIAPSEYYPALYDKLKVGNLIELIHYVDQ